MDCVLILFQKKLDPTVQDPERPCPKPSWGEALKVGIICCMVRFMTATFAPHFLFNWHVPAGTAWFIGSTELV